MTPQNQEKVQILIDALRDIDLYADVADPPFKPQRFGDIARKALSAYAEVPPAPAQGVEEADDIIREIYNRHAAINGDTEPDPFGDLLKGTGKADKQVLSFVRELFTAGSRWQQGQGHEVSGRGMLDMINHERWLDKAITQEDSEVINAAKISGQQPAATEAEAKRPYVHPEGEILYPFNPPAAKPSPPPPPAPPPAPTIGARWVRASERMPGSGENVLMFHKQYGIGIGYCIPLDGSFAGTFHGVSVIDESKQTTHWMPLPTNPTDESPATFPTRDEAQEWVDELGVPAWASTSRAALAMYDWIVGQLKQK